MNKYDRIKQAKPIIPVTKIKVQPQVQPSNDPDVIRFRVLESTFRWYQRRTYHQQAFIKTFILSVILTVPPYLLAYKILLDRAHA